ncbi:sec-independent translocase [Nigerium massiliense]|uniref:sec-independent translocase n=1 Tax=Nigerium massiliense TaxID=1522317 RepID=UPI0006941763|nr:sec-independent translocase [Nigerium massiliense]
MDFNWTEIIVIGILAVVIFGPERLPEFARKVARVIAYLRRIGNDARGQLRDELGPGFDDLHLADLNPKTFVARHLLSEDEKSDLLEIRDEFVETRELARSAAGIESGGASRAVRADVQGDREVWSDGPADDSVDPEFLRAVAYDSEAT